MTSVLIRATQREMEKVMEGRRQRLGSHSHKPRTLGAPRNWKAHGKTVPQRLWRERSSADTVILDFRPSDL